MAKHLTKSKITIYILLITLVFNMFIPVIFATETVEDTSFKGFTFSNITPEDKNVTFEKVVFQSSRQKEYGIAGAGSQWPVSLESSSDGGLMLYGIDVAGMYKSVDHGKTWTVAISGIETRGVGMFAIDPYNNSHVLALGLGTRNGGIHYSYDMATTWKKGTKLPTCGERYLWDGLEFDPTTYNVEKEITMDVYYSTPYRRDSGRRDRPDVEPTNRSVLTEDQVGIYKSVDGGENFELLVNNKKLADGIVKITDDGRVFIGNQYGLFLINKDNGAIIKTYLLDESEDYSKGITGLDVVENTIYVQNWDGIYKLEKDDEEPIMITSPDVYPTTQWPQFLEVSKSNPNHMIYQYRATVTNYYVNRIAVSYDGGQTWTLGTANQNTDFYRASLTAREKIFIIDPSDDNNVVTFGSDCLIRSEDGGLNFVQASGVSNMMQGGKFNFNYYDPDLLLLSAQDYTGVVTKDGGKTYEKLYINGKGNFYGGFAADRNTYFGFANPNWGGGSLTVTHDAGITWEDTGLRVSGVPGSTYYSSLQSPTDPDVLFAAEYYSKDRGYTWNKMDGCASVFTFNYTGEKELYGANFDGNLVVSRDNGDTWEVLQTGYWKNHKYISKQYIVDIAYDYISNCAYVVVQTIFGNATNNAAYTIEEVYKYDITNNVCKFMNIPRDNVRGYMRESTVAVDPNSPSVVYVGGAGGAYSSATSLLRSIDGGNTWEVLTTANTDEYTPKANNQGGYEVSTIRVNPYDSRVWTACGCYGYETFDAPYDTTKINHEKPQEHTIKYMYGDRLVGQATVKNNEKHNYIYEEHGKTFVSWYEDKEFTKEFANESHVYNSMVLYAKLDDSINLKFYDRDTLFMTIDLDEYDPSSEEQIPQRDGYAFAGWYLDQDMTQLADFKTIDEDTILYAGWYKVIDEVFDVSKKDIGDSIDFYTHKLQDRNDIDNDTNSDERCIFMGLDTNSTYLLTFKMDTRFRMGLTKNNFWQYNVVPNYYIDPDDDNGVTPANKYVYKVISTGEYNRMIVHYYSYSGTKDFMDIKNTFKVYKIEPEIETYTHITHVGGRATCITQAVCDICNEFYGELDSTNHELNTTHIVNKVEADCTNCGYTGDVLYDCCDAEKSKGTITQKLEHEYDSGVISKEATYEEDGEIIYTCKNCSQTKKEFIPKLEKEPEQPEEPNEPENPGDNSNEDEPNIPSEDEIPEKTEELEKPQTPSSNGVETGDTVLMYVGILMLAILGDIVILLKKKVQKI